MADEESTVAVAAPVRKARMRLSASRLNTWMTCPMQAKFQYVDRLPRQQHAAATFGSCVHKALEVYGNSAGDLDRALATFKDWWENPDQHGIEPQVWPKSGKSFGSYMKNGIEAITAYHEQMKWHQRTVIATEHPFLVPFGDFDLTGYIDLLEVVKNKKGNEVVKITDFKTNARAPYINALRLNVQFTIYDYASRQKEFWTGANADFPGVPNGEWWWSMAADLPRENIWYGLMQKRPYDAGERTEPDYLRLYRVAKEVERALEHEVYVPNISGDSCGFCSFTAACRLPFDPQADPDDEL